jgi:hypothetical protein
LKHTYNAGLPQPGMNFDTEACQQISDLLCGAMFVEAKLGMLMKVMAPPDHQILEGFGGPICV